MESLTEPVRKSALDVVQYNLRAAGYKSYITRVVYFGEYHGTHEVLRKRMENIIRDLRADYNNMPITGLFLVYPTCYIHVLEAWEDIIYKHYELVYAVDDDECKFGRAIPLPSYHHVHQRYFSGWCHVYTIPPTLLGTLEALDRRSRRATELGRQSGPVSPREHAPRVSLERELVRAQNRRGVFANVFRCVAEPVLGR
ncbi:PREDICTED: uncharacterized protein LOC105449276 isoform X3 [Wasmannia auropunctata]|uniref:uncharacterized protein LOC105449276 isoform X3 n=1 Tax=Wasmannia auropunctata TaxID=64793 RepID=UPI0005EED341|nr:PREDICTED: uncharacterized protein LOC105449276 isoform X3 [Wasmannia auropunctata]